MDVFTFYVLTFSNFTLNAGKLFSLFFYIFTCLHFLHKKLTNFFPQWAGRSCLVSVLELLVSSSWRLSFSAGGHDVVVVVNIVVFVIFALVVVVVVVAAVALFISQWLSLEAGGCVIGL